MITLVLNLKAGWNTVYMSINPSDPEAGAVFPGALSVSWWNKETKSYVLLYSRSVHFIPTGRTTVEAGETYQVAVLNDITYTIIGEPVGMSAGLKIGLLMGGLLVAGSILKKRKHRR